MDLRRPIARTTTTAPCTMAKAKRDQDTLHCKRWPVTRADVVASGVTCSAVKPTFSPTGSGCRPSASHVWMTRRTASSVGCTSPSGLPTPRMAGLRSGNAAPASSASETRTDVVALPRRMDRSGITRYSPSRRTSRTARSSLSIWFGVTGSATRTSLGIRPIAAQIARPARSRRRRIAGASRPEISSPPSPVVPTSWPSASTRRATAGWRSTSVPSRKKVPRTPSSASYSSTDPTHASSWSPVNTSDGMSTRDPSDVPSGVTTG